MDDVYYGGPPRDPTHLHILATSLPPPQRRPLPSHDGELRTLFIAGLPENVKNREIYHLFREFPGFLTSHLRPPSGNSQAFAFAVFADQLSAVSAMHSLNGMVFDLEEGSTLYIDLAKSNSRSKRERSENERTGSTKKHKSSLVLSRGRAELGVGSSHIPGIANYHSHHDTVDFSSARSHLSFDSKDIFDASAGQSDNSPCPTIFVANLGPKCSEKELRHIFSRCRGFLKLKFQRARGSPVAFVDFKDTACSTEALIQLQGTILHSSTHGEGMRLEYPFNGNLSSNRLLWLDNNFDVKITSDIGLKYDCGDQTVIHCLLMQCNG